MKTATEFWKEKFDEYPQNDAEKLAVTMMAEYLSDYRSQPLPEGTFWIEKDAVKEPPEKGTRHIIITNYKQILEAKFSNSGEWLFVASWTDEVVISYLTPTTLPERFTEQEFIDWCRDNGYNIFADNFQDVQKQFLQSLSKK